MGEVHTFLSTCGLTTVGLPQKHKDDDLDIDTMHVIARKCPKVLNDWTQAQPMIDRGNLYRQFELAMEKRFRTESFPFRLFTTVLGMSFVDTYMFHLYHNRVAKADLDFKTACNRMFYALMHNNLDAIEAGEVDDTNLYTISSLPTQTPRPESRAEDNEEHTPVPFSQLDGYDGAVQQWCAICGKKKVTHACLQCSRISQRYIFRCGGVRS